MKLFKDKIINENPIFVLMLGMCSALAVTDKFENAYIMGLCVLVVLVFSNTIISLIKKIVPDNVRIPVYIMIIATFVTAIEMILNSYLPDIYKVLGIYLPLIVVNCIILGRTLSVASKNGLKKSFIDALGIGIGFTISLMLIALVREILGSNTITIMDGISNLTGYKMVYKVLPNNNVFPISIFSSPAGAFLTIGLLMGLFNYLKSKKEVSKNESN